MHFIIFLAFSVLRAFSSKKKKLRRLNFMLNATQSKKQSKGFFFQKKGLINLRNKKNKNQRNIK